MKFIKPFILNHCRENVLFAKHFCHLSKEMKLPLVVGLSIQWLKVLYSQSILVTLIPLNKCKIFFSTVHLFLGLVLYKLQMCFFKSV